MGDTFHFIDPDLVSPTRKQLNRVSQLHEKMLSQQKELLGLIHGDENINDQDAQNSIYPDKASLFKVQWLYKRLFNKKREIIHSAIGGSSRPQSLNPGDRKVIIWKTLAYPSAAAVLVFTLLFIYQWIGDKQDLNRESLSYKISPDDRTKKRARPSSEKPRYDGSQVDTQALENPKDPLHRDQRPQKEIAETHPIKSTAKKKASKSRRTGRNRSKKEGYDHLQNIRREDQSHENLVEKGESSNLTRSITQEDKVDRVESFKPYSIKKLRPPKLRYKDQEAPMGTHNKDADSIRKLEQPSLAFLMDTEKQDRPNRLDPNNLVFPQIQKVDPINLKAPLSTQFYIARLKRLNRLIQKKSHVSHTRKGHYINVNQASKEHYLYLFSLKALHYNHLKDPPKSLVEQIALLSKVLNVNPVIGDLYDIEITISNRFGKDGKVIWRLSQVLYGLSIGGNLSDDKILFNSRYVYKRLKRRKGHTQGFLRLLKQTIRLLKALKKDPNDKISRTALKKLYSGLPIRPLIQ